jgi:hypothetical protein
MYVSSPQQIRLRDTTQFANASTPQVEVTFGALRQQGKDFRRKSVIELSQYAYPPNL